MAKKDNDKNTASAPKENEAKASTPPSHPSLPYILDFSFSVSNLMILLSGVIVTTLSLFVGVPLIHAVIRGGLTMLGLGAVIWLLNYYLSNQVLQTIIKDFQKASDSSVTGDSTVEKQA